MIILTETWLNSYTADLCNFPGYYGYHCYRELKQGGGVSIFISKTLISEPLNLNINTDNIKCIGVKIRDKFYDLSVIGICRAPSGSVTHFVDSLEQILDQYNANSMLAGDFNIFLIKESDIDCFLLSNMLNIFISDH